MSVFEISFVDYLARAKRERDSNDGSYRGTALRLSPSVPARCCRVCLPLAAVVEKQRAKTQFLSAPGGSVL
jgi:hypothetical protein